MQRQSNFLKRVQPKKSTNTKNLVRSLSLSNGLSLSERESTMISLTREDICNFELIGIFDRKVLVTFNNRLKKIGYFDFHAMHERIRYEYYCWKIKAECFLSNKMCLFDEEAIEKGGKKSNTVFGRTNRVLIEVLSPSQSLLGMNFPNTKKNASDKIYVVGYRQILGKGFTAQEIISIIKDTECHVSRIPKVIDQWIGEYACKSAYKFNDGLRNEQARALITNLSRCSFPWHCVHGRTTINLKEMPA